MSSKSLEMNMDALDDLLEAERAALLNGDLALLAEMLPNKKTLIDALGAPDLSDIAGLQSLDQKVKRNQLLLNGALEGIRDVASRMAALRRMKSGLETYDCDGRKNNFEVNTERTLEKRA